MNARIVIAILGKELAETLRDKRTLMAMIGLPLLLYPTIILVMAQAVGVQRAKMERVTSRVAIAGDAAQEFHVWLGDIEKVVLRESDDPAGDLRAGRLDAVVYAPEDLSQLRSGNTAEVRIDYDSTEPKSQQAVQRVQEGLTAVAQGLLTERLEGAGLRPEFVVPLKVSEQNIASPEKRAGFMLGTLLPLLMIMMIGVGAFYPAVDLTAGEKERGTFETLLSTPVRKTEILCAKFLAVICLALLTGLLNLISMAATLGFSLSRAAEAGDGAGFSLAALQISPLGAAIMLLVLIPLTVFIGAAMMSIAIFARDFKEANNYVAPFFLVITIPGALAGMPGVELTRATACIPITNVALLFRELLTQKASAGLTFIVFMSMTTYAMLTLLAAIRLFQSEDVVLSQEKGIPLSLKRSQFQPRSSPTAGLSLTLFGLCLLLFYYYNVYVQPTTLLGAVFIPQWGLLLLPTVLVLAYVRIDLRSALSLRPFAWPALPAMFLIWLGMLVLVNAYGQWQGEWLPLPESYEGAMADLFATGGSAWRTTILVLGVALTPAICEEVLFRGAVLSGLRTALSPWVTVLLVAVMFGLMHITVSSIIPTAMLGVAMTYIVMRSGSIYLAMLFHLLNNSAAIVLNNPNVNARLSDWLAGQGITAAAATGWALAAAVVCATAGLVLLEITARRSPPPRQ